MLSKQDFFEAVEKGDLEKVKSILESKRDKYGSPCYPDTVKEIVSHDNGLTMAARLGHDDILKYLLDYGMDPNARTGERNQSALHYAAMKDFRNITGLLLKYKPNHKIECVRKKSLDINIKDRKDQTPLLLAVSENHTEIVKMLLNAGADPNICNFRQVTPLSISSYRGNTADVSHRKHSRFACRCGRYCDSSDKIRSRHQCRRFFRKDTSDPGIFFKHSLHDGYSASARGPNRIS